MTQKKWNNQKITNDVGGGGKSGGAGMMSQIESPMAIGNFDQCHIEPNSMFDQNLWCPD